MNVDFEAFPAFEDRQPICYYSNRKTDGIIFAEVDFMKIRMRYIFTGWVQGVGFRYRAYHAAQMLGITGFVRNESDGSVMMEAQGERPLIDKALEMIAEGRFINIENIESEKLPSQPDESSFEILG